MASLHAHKAADGTARWIVRWREGGRDSRQRSRSFHRKADARNFQADIIRRGQLGELYEADGGTVGEFLDGWLARYALRVRKPSSDRRRHALRALDSLRGRLLASLSASQVEDAVTAVAERAPRQAELALASLKLALKDAAKRGLRFDRRILELASPKSRARKPTFLDWEQVCEVASWMPNDAYNRLVRVAALTGLRRGEILALTWADIDLDRRALAVREGKTDAATRSVDLSLRAARLLRVHKGRALSEASTARTDGKNRAAGDAHAPAGVSLSAPVFPNNQGGAHDGHNFYNRLFKPAARAAKQPDLTFHGLRHSYISMMAAAGAHPSVIAAQVGHKDGGALILRRYRHLFPHEGREAADRLDDYLGRRT